jgi:hypothetical protein
MKKIILNSKIDSNSKKENSIFSHMIDFNYFQKNLEQGKNKKIIILINKKQKFQ